MVIQRRKREFINRVKNVACKDCGIKYPPAAMDFGHRDPSKKRFNMGIASASVGMRRLTGEINKCDVVCANCHRIRHWTNDKATPPVEMILWQGGII